MTAVAGPGPLTGSADFALAFRLLAPVPAVPRRLLVLLHGVGGHEGQLAALGARAGDDTLVVLPRGPRPVGCAGFGWFRVAFTPTGPEIVPDEAEDSRLALIEFIRQLQRRYGLDAANTVVAGFSQGGVLSASVALTAPDTVAGFAVLGGRILPELEPVRAAPAGLSGLDGLIVHGRADDKLPMAWAERASAWLQRLGVPHALRLFAGGHALAPAMQAHFLQWLEGADRRWNR